MAEQIEGVARHVAGENRHAPAFARRRHVLLVVTLALPTALIAAGIPAAWALLALPLAMAAPLAGLPGLLGALAVAGCAVTYASGLPGADGAAMALGLGALAAAGIAVGVAHSAQVAAAERAASLDFIQRLTALAADDYFHYALGREAARSAGRGTPLGLIVIDLDGFTDFNRAYGAHTGDRMLAAVGEVVAQATSPGDVAVRLGEGQFAVLAACGAEEAAVLGERIRREVSALRVPAPRARAAAVTASAGLSSAQPGDDERGAALLDRAERALDEAKASGRDRVIAFSPEHHRWVSSAA